MLVAKDLQVRAGARLLIDGASFQIAPGDKVGLVGRNGAGKTTLTKILAGEAVPAAGTVQTAGEVGYLPQDPRIGNPEVIARDRILSARGLDAVILRSGYVMGDAKTGVSNLDDFLVRMLKGRVQVSARPEIANTINMVPVPHVAKLVLAMSLRGKGGSTAHVEAHPRLTMDQYLATLEQYGYSVPSEPYESWAKKVEAYVEAGDD